MNAGKRGSLTDFASVKPSAPQTEKPVVASSSSKDQRKGQTLRLSSEAWKQLKLIALEREITAHALLIEAVNDLFRKHGKKPIA